MTRKQISSTSDSADLFRIENPWERQLFADHELEEASGLSVRSLRAIQALGFIRAEIAKRPKGAQKRAWPLHDAMKACLVSQIATHAGLSLQTAVRLLMIVPEHIVFEMVEQTATMIQEAGGVADDLVGSFDWPVRKDGQIVHETGDIAIAIVNRRYVFIEGRYPELEEDAPPGTSSKLVGVVQDVYSREPRMRQIKGELSSSVVKRTQRLLEHHVSIHRINLELALRQQVAMALGLSFQR